MPLRRRAWLTREGWYYATVLTFIIGGAVLRSINLLVILAGTMIASLLFNWRLAMASLTGLTVRRRIPEQIVAGQPLTVEIVVENTRWWMSSWLLIVEDWAERVDGSTRTTSRSAEAATVLERNEMHQLQERPLWARLTTWLSPRIFLRRPATRAEARFAHIPARGQAIATYRITLHRRGRYRFGALRVSTRFPLALVRAQMTLLAAAECIVAPRLGRLLPEWTRLLDADPIGDQRRHPQRGLTDGDYYGLRPWQSGDSLRWVHWRTTAKLGRPVVRQYERRKSRDLALLLDPWLPPQPTEEDAGRLELAISLAATAVNEVTGHGGSRLVFAIGGPQAECYCGAASPLFCQEILVRLSELPASGTSTLAESLERTLDAAGPDTRLIVISPRAADAPSLAANSAELPIDPDDLMWIDTGSEQLASLFVLD